MKISAKFECYESLSFVFVGNAPVSRNFAFYWLQECWTNIVDDGPRSIDLGEPEDNLLIGKVEPLRKDSSSFEDCKQTGIILIKINFQSPSRNGKNSVTRSEPSSLHEQAAEVLPISAGIVMCSGVGVSEVSS